MSSRVDPGEIRKFEAMAAEWWDPRGKFKPLHLINPLRVDYISRHTALKNANVLDVGCGGGLLAEALATHGARVCGIDRSPKALHVARLHAQQSGVAVDYQESDAETWAETHAESYDVVTCLEVLEHVPDLASTVTACARMLKPGGRFFFATINRTLKSFAFAIIGAEYVLGWLPRGTHRYEKFIRPSELAAAVRHTGLEVVELRGISYDLLRDAFKLSDDLTVNYLGTAFKPS